MKLSTRTRYGTRLLVDLAIGEGKISLKEISGRQQVSRSYLQHLIAPLVHNGIIGSTRGSSGGIWLIRQPDQIKLSGVVKLLEGNRLLVESVNNPEVCSRSALCRTREMWERIERAMFNIIDSITLEDLINQSKDDTDNYYYEH